MSEDSPWLDRAIFFGLHLHNSWLFLPIASILCFAGLYLLRQREVVKISLYRLFVFSAGILPILIYSTKDVALMLARGSHGYMHTLKYAYLVLGLPTLVLFVVASILLAIDRRLLSKVTVNHAWWPAAVIVLLCTLNFFQSLWLFEADASL